MGSPSADNEQALTKDGSQKSPASEKKEPLERDIKLGASDAEDKPSKNDVPVKENSEDDNDRHSVEGKKRRHRKRHHEKDDSRKRERRRRDASEPLEEAKSSKKKHRRKGRHEE